MSELTSTTSYLLRAIHEWCLDNGLTPHLLVKVNSHTTVPLAYVKEGEIVLNINFTAVKDLHIDTEAVSFSARFGGVAQQIYVPITRVAGIFARENGQGMFFEVTDEGPQPATSTTETSTQKEGNATKKSHLKVVK